MSEETNELGFTLLSPDERKVAPTPPPAETPAGDGGNDTPPADPPPAEDGPLFTPGPTTAEGEKTTTATEGGAPFHGGYRSPSRVIGKLRS